MEWSLVSYNDNGTQISFSMWFDLELKGKFQDKKVMSTSFQNLALNIEN